MIWLILAVAVIFGAACYDIVGGVQPKNAVPDRRWQGFAAGFFLGPIGVIVAWMIRTEIRNEQGRGRR